MISEESHVLVMWCLSGVFQAWRYGNQGPYILVSLKSLHQFCCDFVGGCQYYPQLPPSSRWIRNTYPKRAARLGVLLRRNAYTPFHWFISIRDMFITETRGPIEVVVPGKYDHVDHLFCDSTRRGGNWYHRGEGSWYVIRYDYRVICTFCGENLT